MSESTQLSPQQKFSRDVLSLAQSHLCKIAGEERGKQLAAQFAMTFDAAARRDPKILDCTRDSIAQALATSIFTGLQAGGPAPECYLIPRSNRRQVDGQWQSVSELNWMISWRGMLTLAGRSGYGIRAVCVHMGDTLTNDGDALDLLSWAPPKLVMGDGERTMDTLRGVVVVAYDKKTREFCGWEWVPNTTIVARRNVSDAYQRGISTTTTEGYGRSKTTREKTAEEIERGRASPWFQWPLEMALKTGIRYAISRALVPIDVTMAAAMTREDEDDRNVIDAEVATQPAQSSAPKGRAALGLVDRGEPAVETQPARQPDPVRTTPATDEDEAP